MSEPFTRRPFRAHAMSRGYGWFLYPGFVILVVFFVTMFVWNIGISLLRWPGYGPATWVGLDNYGRLFGKSDFWESWVHAFFYVLPFAIAPTLVALVLAFTVYDAFRSRVARALVPFARAGFFLPQIVPISVAGVIWLWMLDTERGLVNTSLRDAGLNELALSWLTEPEPALFAVSAFMFWLQMGFAFVVYLAGFSRLDPGLLEAASIDGANAWQRFRYIAVSSVAPETIVVLTFLGVGALKVFAPVYYLTGGGPYDSTSSPASYAVTSFFGGGSVGYAAAVATVLALVILVVVSVVGIATARRPGSWRNS